MTAGYGKKNRYDTRLQFDFNMTTIRFLFFFFIIVYPLTKLLYLFAVTTTYGKEFTSGKNHEV